MSERLLCSLGALAIVVIGAVHLELWAWHGYRNVHIIGPLFLLNAIGAAGLAVLLRRRPSRRLRLDVCDLDDRGHIGASVEPTAQKWLPARAAATVKPANAASTKPTWRTRNTLP